MLSSTQILEYLENCGADLLHGEIEGLPACAMYSLLAPNTNVLEYLFRKEYLTSQHISPLLFALAKSRASSEEVFGEFLIQKGADINEMNSDGDGLLHIAVMHNNLAFLAFALSHGAKRDQKNASGLTALSVRVRFSSDSPVGAAEKPGALHAAPDEQLPRAVARQRHSAVHGRCVAHALDVELFFSSVRNPGRRPVRSGDRASALEPGSVASLLASSELLAFS